MTIALARYKTALVLLHQADGLPSLDPAEQALLQEVIDHQGAVSPARRAEFYALFLVELFGADLGGKATDIQNEMQTATGNPTAIAAPAAVPLRATVEYVNYQFQWGAE